MPTFLLAIYTALILIRPMDWWGPMLEWQLVTVAAIATLLVAFPRILEEGGGIWNRLPELKVGVAWVLGATASFLPIFWLGGMNRVFQDMGKIYVYFFLIFLLVRSNKDYRILIWTILLCTVWMAIHAILQHHRGYGFANQPPLMRTRSWESDEVIVQAKAFGIFEDPNDLCLMFIISVPLFYAEFQTATQPLLKGLALIGMPLVGYGVWLTNSRGGYLGVFAMVAAYFVSRTKGYKRWFLIGFSVLFLTLFAPSRFSAGLVGQQDRSILWGDGMAMFKANPFFGIGFYQFSYFQVEHKVAHNTYVEVLAETGMIGYIPFFLMVYFGVVHLRRAMDFGPLLRQEDRLQMAGMFSAAVGYFTSIYFLSREKIHVPYILLGLMGALTIRACYTPEMLNMVFVQSAKEYRRAVYWALGSVGFMWITIRIVNSLGQ